MAGSFQLGLLLRLNRVSIFALFESLNGIEKTSLSVSMAIFVIICPNITGFYLKKNILLSVRIRWPKATLLNPEKPP
jgi:hypothetical protein|tara:strand:- start:210 stop:440 length:231 start_codon:yes stop_codon:yes gene_type:complete